ncbi:MAG: hypothetical protein WCK01_00790 [Candidatus Uhrbacteria bacterium]
MAKARSLHPSHRTPNTVPKRTVSVHDIYLALLHAEAKRLEKLELEVLDIQFEDRELGANLLLALQTYPKPGKVYVVKLPSDSGVTQPFEVEPLPNYVFRVSLKKT